MQLYDKDLLSMQEVRELVEGAKEAQKELANMSQSQVDHIVRAIADAGVRNARRLAVTETPLYRYLQNPASATHKYMKDFQQVFGRFMERKEDLAARYGLTPGRPQWRENSNWAGLLIAIGNEYAPGNPKTLRQRQETIQALCARPDMAHAIRTLSPAGMSRNKQLAAKLVRGGRFWLLSQLYRIKNRI